MAYNLPLQLLIQPPTASQLNNIRQQIESSLSGINVGAVDTKNFAKTNATLQQTGKQFDKTGEKAQKFWNAVEGRTRSAIEYSVISTALLKITSSISQATREAIKYEAELLKISQVTGDSVQLTKEYSKSLVDISKKYNVTLSKVAQLTRTLNQTGLSFKEAAKGAEVLARTSLLATFDSLTSTTEGLIAVMQTFEFTVTRAGKVLESINSVSKAFAVESTDIVEAIRRTGGAFSTAGGSIEELIALFTAVRSTSRESAETIATGFRTIFGRLQRPKTIEYFKQLGIQLETAEGQFIGPYQAIEQISKGLERLGIAAGSTRFAEVVEQIGGIRQISRVVPLLEQAAKSQKALDIANSGTVDSIKDVEKAQQGLGYQLGALQKEFGALISDIVNSPSFKFLAEVFINTSKAVLRLVSALKPLLPILASVAAFKIGRGLSKLLSGSFSLKGAKESLGFASGGMVPGSGNGDTVPAMLTPGEFVIRKSAVKAFGADRLSKINKYATGGIVELTKRKPSIGKYYDTDITGIEDRYNVTPTDKTLSKSRDQYRNEAKVIWKQAIKEGSKAASNDYIAQQTGGFAGRGTQTLGDKELDPNYLPQDGRKYNKIAGGLAELDVKKMLKNAKKLADIEGPDFEQQNGEFVEVKTTKRKVPEKEIIAKAVLAEGIKKGNYKDGSIQTVDPKITYIRAMNKGGFVQKFKNGGVAEDTKLSQSLIDTLRQYTSGGLDKGLNLKLFNESTGADYISKRDYSNEISNLDSLMKFDLPGVLYSGLSSHHKHEAVKNKIKEVSPDRRNPDHTLLKGEVLSFPGYFSTSLDKAVAERFSGGPSGGLMTIATNGKGVDVQKVIASSGMSLSDLENIEREFILPRNSKFKVLDISESNKKSALDNYLLDVQQLATGGKPKGTGTDTVPALLTPGEFVINKKSAQAFGYDKLHEINKYADGGFVQHFKNGGMSKAERTLSKAERKRLLEQSKAEKSADGLTRAGRREAGQLARGKDEVDFIAVQEKWTKYIDEETKNAKEVYQAKVKQVQEEGGSIKEMSALIKEYDSVVQTIKSEAKGYQRKEEESISAKNIVEAQAEVKQKESDAATAETPAAKEVEKATKSLAQKIKDGGGAVYDSLSSLGVSYAEAAFQAQNIVSGLKNFAGLDVNQEALTQAQVKGGVLSGAGEAVGKFADPKVIQGFGSQLNKVGKMLPKSIGGPVRKLGGVLLKNGASIAKGAATVAKGLNVLSFVELGGGLLDALFSTDYGKQRDNLIALGDAAGAASAAAQAYSQEQYRAIPLIGGFLSAMGAGSQATEADLDSTGKLVVANARLEANLNGVDREVTKAKDAFKDAQALGDVQGQQDAISGQLDAVDTLKANAEDVAAKTDTLRASGAATYGSGASIGMGAAGGAIAGAAIGSFVPIIGTVIGGIAGAAIGGAAGWMSSSKLSKEQIIKGYELQGEAAKKAAEVQAELISSFTSRLQAESVRMIKSGGTYEDAIANVTEQIGQENVNRILDGQQLTGNAEEDIKMATSSVEAIDARIMSLKEEANLLKDSEKTKRAELEAQIATEEGEREKALALKNGLVQTQAAIIREKKLEERRQLAAKAMERQIRLMKELESTFDSFNSSIRELSNIDEIISNIGTSRLTTREAAARSGFNNPALYEMNASDILRNPNLSRQSANMAERVGLTAGANEIRQGQARLGTISSIQELAKSGELGDILKSSTGAGEETSAKEIQTSIYKKLGLTEGADPILDESIRKYAETLASEGIAAAGQAEEEARNAALAESKKVIETVQQKAKELFDAEKKLRDYEIELTKRRQETAQKTYDVEKNYFNSRMELYNKVEDALNSGIPMDQRNARNVAAREQQKTAFERAALQERRSKQFQAQGVDLGNIGLGQAVDKVVAGFRAAGTASEKLQGQMDALLNTIQDEIDIEKKRLDSLIESARTQQELDTQRAQATGSIARQLVTGTDEEKADLLMTLNAGQYAAAQGNFAGIPQDFQEKILSTFESFGESVVPGFGGRSGKQISEDILTGEFMRSGLFAGNADAAREAARGAVGRRQPLREQFAEQIQNQGERIDDLIRKQKALNDARLAEEEQNNNKFADSVREFGDHVQDMRNQLNGGLGVGGNRMPVVNNRRNASDAQQVAGTAGNNTTTLPRLGDGLLQTASLNGDDVQTIRDNDRSPEYHSSRPLPVRTNTASPTVRPVNNLADTRPRTQQDPIQVESNGQLEFTIRMPDLQGYVDRKITEIAFNAIGEKFMVMSSDVRYSSNFDELGNVFAKHSNSTQNIPIA